MLQPSILVVDDDPSVNQLLAVALGGEGFAVICASTAEEALAECRRHRDVNLLLTDVELGDGMNGLDLAAVLLRDFPALKVLVISGTTEYEAKARENCWPFLKKPFDVASLLNGVRETLFRSGAQPETRRPPGIIDRQA